MRQIPLPRYGKVVDLCCGTGRHARPLAVCGYSVLGVDRSGAALTVTRGEPGPQVAYREQDMRNFSALPGPCDAVLCLWQSFGYFDDATNRDILRQIYDKLSPGGRLILDVYHREFFERHQEPRKFIKNGILVNERKKVDGGRLSVDLSYGNGATDAFDWRLYTPDELYEMGTDCGFRCRVSCTGFEERKPPSPEKARMQVVFEKPG